MEGRRFMLWWPRNEDEAIGVGHMMVELHENLVDVSKMSDIVMAIVVFF